MEKEQTIKVKLYFSSVVKDYERLITVRRVAELVSQAGKQGKWKK